MHARTDQQDDRQADHTIPVTASALQVLKNVSGTINSTASDVQKTVNKVRAR
jgi:hypothetical protein